jgi:endonuclease G
MVAFLGALLLATAAHASPRTCPEHFLGGTPPKVWKESLEPKSRLLCASSYAVLHSGQSRTPLWSAEHLTAERIEAAEALSRPKRNTFHADPRVPRDERAELADYARSGYDRGHMSPSGDMPTIKAQHESFLLSNMIPQHPCNNEVLWEGIESVVRDLTLRDGELYVVTGPVFEGENLQALNGRVLVPTSVFKAVYDPARRRAAAYLAPNDGSQTWQAISIRRLSDVTGIDVFPGVSEAVKAQASALPEPTPHGGCRIQP